MADKIRVSTSKDITNYEMTDSENEMSDTDKKLFKKVRKRFRNDSESEDEVLAFSQSEESEDDDFGMADSDVEGQEASDDNLPNAKAWGKNKQTYYSTDFVDQDYGGFQDDEEAALLEEEEARAIQKRLMEQLGEEDFSFEMFSQIKQDEPVIDKTIIKSDLSQLSKRQKLQLFEKESPEFAGLVDDFKNKLTVAKDEFKPVLKLVKSGKLPDCSAYKFVQTNYDLIMNYCTNISFYLLLKSKRVNIHNHPVIKKLYQYRQMLNQLEPIYIETIKPQIETILKASEENADIVAETKKRKKSNFEEVSKSKKLRLVSSLEKAEAEDTGVSDNEDEYDGKEYLEIREGPNKISESEESGFSDNAGNESGEETTKEVMDKNNEGKSLDIDEPEKRKITYQIAKNKGLTPHRKKEQKNPRVKHKLKYRKAKIRRKGAVREVRKEVNKYSGELSGIKTNIRKSIKIK